MQSNAMSNSYLVKHWDMGNDGQSYLLLSYGRFFICNHLQSIVITLFYPLTLFNFFCLSVHGELAIFAGETCK